MEHVIIPLYIYCKSKCEPGKWLGEILRQLILFPLLRWFAPLQINGSENLQGVGPYIFIANHTSHLDALVLLAALPWRLRLRVQIAAAADYFFNRCWKGALLKLALNLFPFVRKGEGCHASLEVAHQKLRIGQSLLIFPEGTRSPNGQLQPFKRGIGHLALTERVQVVPIWIEGTYAAMPKGARWPHRHPVTITFGQPLSFAPGNHSHRITTELEQQVRLLGQKSQVKEQGLKAA
jgi:1-acyl-sn-glycerol-3-phosphate acyltransferase